MMQDTQDTQEMSIRELGDILSEWYHKNTGIEISQSNGKAWVFCGGIAMKWVIIAMQNGYRIRLSTKNYKDVEKEEYNLLIQELKDIVFDKRSLEDASC
jgi:hypothetical protein